jgi:hypothetical protein
MRTIIRKRGIWFFTAVPSSIENAHDSDDNLFEIKRAEHNKDVVVLSMLFRRSPVVQAI